MQIIIRPLLEPHREVDLTNRLISAIADELAQLYGGNEQLNWLEAERHLQGIVDSAPAGMSDTPACPGCPRRRAKSDRRALSNSNGRESVGAPRRTSLTLVSA